MKKGTCEHWEQSPLEARCEFSTRIHAGNIANLGFIPSKIYSAEMAEFSERYGAHVYLVCTKPRVRVTTLGRSAVAKDALHVKLQRQAVGDTEAYDHSLLLYAEGDLATATLNPTGTIDTGPRRQERLTGTEFTNRIVASFLGGSAPSEVDLAYQLMEEFSTLTVVYVGQAYGTGSRTAADRLTAGHEKLSKVLAEIHDYSPNLEAYVLLIDCQDRGLTMGGTVTADNAQDLALWTMLARNGYGFESERDVVDVIEGSLVRLFQPSLNIRLRGFPNKRNSRVARSLVERGFTHVVLALTVNSTANCLRMPNGERRLGVIAHLSLKTGEICASEDPFEAYVLYSGDMGRPSSIPRLDKVDAIFNQSRRV